MKNNTTTNNTYKVIKSSAVLFLAMIVVAYIWLWAAFFYHLGAGCIKLEQTRPP